VRTPSGVTRGCPGALLAAGNASVGRLLGAQDRAPGAAAAPCRRSPAPCRRSPRRERGDGQAASIGRRSGGEVTSRRRMLLESMRAADSGTALPQGFRERAESSFGADFADVRVHRDAARMRPPGMCRPRRSRWGRTSTSPPGATTPTAPMGDTCSGRAGARHAATTGAAAAVGRRAESTRDPAEQAPKAAGEGSPAVSRPWFRTPARRPERRGSPCARSDDPTGRGRRPGRCRADRVHPLDGRQISSNPTPPSGSCCRSRFPRVSAARQVELGLRLRRADLGLDRRRSCRRMASGWSRSPRPMRGDRGRCR